ncbi:2OG-Fe(II) oxygenase, partial [uncultured Sphingomonas sp.]|uniref:prolyl hydroxylase family protein n=1 Tax=uncultured Sphingomonas sp. TaxID=158754 RepID=UPI0025FF3361
NRRIAAATGTTYEQGEPMQVLSYAPGQQYKLHSDALTGDVNQRVVTFLVYLNDDYDGGATVFPDLHLMVRGSRGEGLLFRNVTAEGAPHPLARHAGQPVTSGRKMLLSKWIRMSPLDLSGPPGRPL